MTPLTDDQMNLLMGEAPTAKPQTYVAPDLQDPVQLEAVANGTYKAAGQYSNPWTAPFEYVRDNYELGEVPVVRGTKGVELMLNPDISEEAEKIEIDGLTTPHLDMLSKKVNLMSEKLGPWNFFQFAGDAANIAPSSIESLKGAGVGGAVGAGAGALAGGGLATWAAGPEFAATGAKQGAQWGWRLGAGTGGYLAATKMNMGNVYLDLREKGISKAQATQFAGASGVIMGGLEYFGLRQMTAVGRRAFARQLRTPEGQAAVETMVEKFRQTGVFGNILEGAASETITEDLQEVTQITAEAMAVWAETGEEVWTSPKFWENVTNRVAETTIKTARGSLFLSGGAEVTGSAAGKTAKTFTDIIRKAQEAEAQSRGALADVGWNALKAGDLSPREVFSVIQQALAPSGQEQLDEAVINEMDTGQALDLLQNPTIQTEDGKTTITTGIQNDPLTQEETEETTGEDAVVPGEQPIDEVEKWLQENPLELDESPEAVTVLEEETPPTQEATVQLPKAAAGQLQLPLVEEEAQTDSTGADGASPLAETAGVGSVATSDEEQKFQGLEDENPQYEGLTEVEKKARLSQINTDLNQLAEKQRQLEKNLNENWKKGRKTAALLSRLEKAMEQREQMELERDLLEAELLTRDDVATSKGRVRMSTLAKLVKRIEAGAERVIKNRENFQRRVTRATGQAFKKGRAAEARAIYSLQQQLIQIVNAATKNGKFRTKLKTLINKVRTKEQFNKAAQRIRQELQRLEDQKSRQEYDAQRGQILADIDKMIRDRVRYTNGRPTQQLIDPDTLAKIELFRDFREDEITARKLRKKGAPAISKADAEMQNFYTQYGADYQAGQLQNIPDEALERFKLATMAYELDNKSLIELNVIAGNVGQWLDDGKNEMAAKKAALKQQREDELAAAKSSVGVDPDRPQQKAKSKKPRQEKANSFAGTLSWNSLLDWFSPKDPEHKITEMLDTTEAKGKYYAGKELSIQVMVQQLTNALVQAGSKINLQEKIFQDSNTPVTLQYVDQNGNPQVMEIDRAQVIEAWLKLQDTSSHAAMRDTETGNAWTFTGEAPQGQSFQEAVESTLKPEDIALGRAVLDFYKDYHARFNLPYREKYGVDLPMRENYSPLNRKGYRVDPGDGLQFSSLLPGAAISRTNNLLKIELQNPFDALEAHINQVEHFIAFDSVLGTVRNVFSDSDIRETIQDRHGDGALKVVNDYTQRFIKGSPTNWSSTDGWLGLMMSDLAFAALGFRPVYQLLTQFTSGIALTNNYNPVEVIKGVGAYLQNLKATEQAFKSSPVLAQRYRGGMTYDFELALRNNGIGLNTISALLGVKAPSLSPKAYKAYTSFLFGAMRSGDAGVARAFGGPIYWAEIARGKSPEEAMMTVERLMEQTQQSSAVDQMPFVYANNQLAYMLFGQFRLQPLQLYNLTQTAIRDFFNQKPTPKNFLQLGKKLLTLWMLQGLMFGVMKNLPVLLAPPEDDDDRDTEAAMDIFTSALLGPANAVPFFGEVIEAIWWSALHAGTNQANLTKGEPFQLRFLGDNPIYRTIVEDPGKAIMAWWKLLKPEEEDGIVIEEDDDGGEKLGKAVGATIKAGAQLTGIPKSFVEIPANTIGAIQKGDFIGALFGLGGFSGSKIKARTRAEDEDGIVVEDDDETINLMEATSEWEAQIRERFGLDEAEEPEEEEPEQPAPKSVESAMIEGISGE